MIKPFSTNKFSSISRKIKFKLFKTVSIKTKKNKIGNVLLSYKTEPFILSENKIFEASHTNTWECYEIANIFLNLGYSVDIIDWDNVKFIPQKNYALFLDIHFNIERLNKIINKDCVKVLLTTGAHWIFQNHAEYQRLLKLKDRRGIALLPRRIIQPNLSAENADYILTIGNKFTIGTYTYLNKPIHPISVSATTEYDFPENKDFIKNRKNYIWLSGGGAIHKGLDLILETFSSMPDYNLIICGPISAEEDFVNFFHKELYETPNIKTVNKIDIKSQEFIDIANNSVGLIHPSCSEGQSGSVIAGMHIGLIPIISYESGVDVKDFGEILRENTVEEIKKSIIKVSSLSQDELKNRSKQSWESAKKNNTREKFSQEFSSYIEMIINKNIL